MKMTLNEAKAFLAGAGFAPLLKIMEEDEIQYLTRKRLKKIGMEVEFIKGEK